MILLVFERKVLRMIVGAICVKGEWRIRYNDEVYQLFGLPNIDERIRTKRLRWSRHVERMDQTARKACFS